MKNSGWGRKKEALISDVFQEFEFSDDFIFAHHPTLLDEIKAARKEFQTKGGIDHETMKQRILRA